MQNQTIAESYLVTLLEAVKVSQHRTIEDLLFVKEMSENFECNWSGKCSDDPLWYYMCLLGTIFTAGRIQGVREERIKKRKETK